MSKACTCEPIRAVPGKPFAKGRDCVWCWRWLHLPAHRERRGGNPEECAVVPIADAGSPHPRYVVPQPPQLVLRPTSKLAVVTVVVGAESRRLFAASGPGMSRYAKRLGADLVALDWPGHPRWPISCKFALGRVLDHYERIAFVDADVLIRPQCASLFDQCDPSEFGAFDELPARTEYLKTEYRRFRQDFQYQPKPLLWYVNTGVMVVSREHQRFLLPPAFALPSYHCAEQDYINAELLDAFRRGEVKVRCIDQRFNWMNWMDIGFRRAPDNAMLHWAGSQDRCKRAPQMREWAARFPWP